MLRLAITCASFDLSEHGIDALQCQQLRNSAVVFRRGRLLAVSDSHMIFHSLGRERRLLPGSPELRVLACFEVEFVDFANTTTPPSEYDARVRVTWDEAAQRYIAERFEVIGSMTNPVTTTGMRQVPIAHFVTWACSAPGVVVDAEGRDAASSDYFAPDEIRAAKQAGPAPGTLEMVAVVYRAASVTGWKPAQRVADVFGLPRRTATHWIMLARERGHLPFGEADGDG